MNRVRSALILCGSPKGNQSASREIGAYLARRLEARGVTTRLRTPAPLGTLVDEVRAVDLLVLTFPLYADGIPARLKEALMTIASARPGPKFCAAVVQCGFIESHQNDTAIEMCRLFARDAGFVWLGGLGRGAGGMIAGKPLEKAPAPLHASRTALDLAAGFLASGEPFSEEIREAFRAQVLPRWIYVVAADIGFLLQLFRHGRIFSLFRRPYDTNGS